MTSEGKNFDLQEVLHDFLLTGNSPFSKQVEPKSEGENQDGSMNPLDLNESNHSAADSYDSVGEEEPITKEVEGHPFVLVIKTLSNCGSCIKLQKHKSTLMSILPDNVSWEEVVIDDGSQSKSRHKLFMHSREGMTVPSAFLLTKQTWDRYLSSQLEEKDLSIDLVSKQIGLVPPFDMDKFKRWISDCMHRLYISQTRNPVSEVDSMLLLDMEFPLIQFKEHADSSHEGRARHGKAYYVSSKCTKRICPRESKEIGEYSS